MKKYRTDIDGLRAIAVLSVVFFHAKFYFEKKHLLAGGFIGVDIFFVISGFLITSNVFLNLKNQSFLFKDFYTKRIKRILPALYFVIFCTAPFSWILLLPDQFKSFTGSIASTLLFFSNFYFWKDSGYFAGENSLKPLLHTWSLSIEEQYYFVLPVVLLLLVKYSKEKTLFMVSFLMFMSLLYCVFDPLARAWELLAGSCLALFYSGKKGLNKSQALSLFGIALILISICFFSKSLTHPGFFTIFPVLGCCLVLGFNPENSILYKLLSSKILRFFGLISYSLYLWHQPIFSFSEVFLANDFNWQSRITAIGVSILLSALSWKFIETPFRHSNIIKTKFTLVLLMIGSLILLSFSYFSVKYNGFPERFSSEVQSAANVKSYSRQIFQNGKHCFARATDDFCEFGSPGKNNWVFLGDSHAEVLSSGLYEQIKEESEVYISILTSSGCPFIPDFTRYSVNFKPNDCVLRNSQKLKILESLAPSKVVISFRAGPPFENAFFDNKEGGKESGPYNFNHFESLISENGKRVEGLKASIHKYYKLLISKGHTLVLIYPIPEVGWHLPKEVLRRSLRGMPAEVTTSYTVYKERNRFAIEAFDSLGLNENIIRVRPAEILCSNESLRCKTYRNGQILYSDSNHLSKRGVELVVDKIFSEMKNN